MSRKSTNLSKRKTVDLGYMNRSNGGDDTSSKRLKGEVNLHKIVQEYAPLSGKDYLGLNKDNLENVPLDLQDASKANFAVLPSCKPLVPTQSTTRLKIDDLKDNVNNICNCILESISSYQQHVLTDNSYKPFEEFKNINMILSWLGKELLSVNALQLSHQMSEQGK